MFNKNIKLVLAAAIIGYAIYQITETYVGNGVMLILLSLIFVFLYFKNEMILLAFLKLRKQDFPGTECLLNKIKNPKTHKLIVFFREFQIFLNSIYHKTSNILTRNTFNAF